MSFAERHVLEWLIFLPMLTAAVLVVLPAGWRMAARWVGVGSGALLMAGSAWVFIAFDYSAGADTFQLVKVYTWIESAGIDFRLESGRHRRADDSAHGHRCPDRLDNCRER